VAAEKREPLSEDEAAKLIECLSKYGFSWEEMANEFVGRTGLQLKNYYYTAKRRFERRKRGMRYTSRIAFPTIDAYFETLALNQPEVLARGRKRSPSPIVEDDGKRVRMES
jgi:hypothetical protein